MKRAKCKRRPPLPPGSYPWLVYYHGRGLRDQSFCTISEPNNNSYYRVRIPELRNKYVWNCCHGWLILSDENDQFFSLWNPVTFESICLPPLKLNPNSQINDCILSLPPGDSRTAILLFDGGVSSIWFCRLEDKQWIEKGYSLEIKTLIGEEEEEDMVKYSGDYSLRQVSCVDGKLYATTFPGISRLVMIELIEPNVLAITSLRNKLPSVNVLLSPRVICNLVESCGELFFIEIVDGGINHPEALTIEIFRLDFSSMVWNRVDSVEDRVFFLDPNSALSCSAPNYCSETAGNRVYFTVCRDKSLYSYNMEDGSVSVSLPRQNLPTPWKAPFWVMPNISDARNDAAKEEQGSMEREEEVQKAEQHSKEGMEVTAEIEKKNMETRESDTTQFSDLLVDILRSFSHLLTLVDYMSFRAVCKSCLLIAPPIKWRTAMSGISKCNSLPPWLLTIERSRNICSLVDPNHGDRYLVSLPKPLQDATLCLCKDGWLMMCKYEPFDRLCVFFFNPFTKEIIQYPELPRVGFDFVFFSSTPTSSNCIVFVATVWGNSIALFICRSREEGWSSVCLESDSDFTACVVIRNYTIPIVINKSFYFLSEEGNIGILRLGNEDDDCSWEVIGNFQKPCNSFNRIFLTECNGELLSVFIGRLGKGIKVFKLNTSTMAWERVKDLGNHTIYFSRSSALSTEAKTLEMANRIYLPRFCGQHLVSYSLSRDEYHSLGNEVPFHDYYGTREPLMCSWIEPTWS